MEWCSAPSKAGLAGYMRGAFFFHPKARGCYNVFWYEKILSMGRSPLLYPRVSKLCSEGPSPLGLHDSRDHGTCRF